MKKYKKKKNLSGTKNIWMLLIFGIAHEVESDVKRGTH